VATNHAKTRSGYLRRRAQYHVFPGLQGRSKRPTGKQVALRLSAIDLATGNIPDCAPPIALAHRPFKLQSSCGKAVPGQMPNLHWRAPRHRRVLSTWGNTGDPHLISPYWDMRVRNV